MKSAKHIGIAGVTRLMSIVLIVLTAGVGQTLLAADTITTLAGNGVAGFSGDGGDATAAQLNMPYGIAVDPQGRTLIADSANNCVRRVNIDGKIVTIAGNGSAGYSGDGGPATGALLNGPLGVSTDAFGNIYIADTGNNVVRRIDRKTLKITTVAGNGTAGFSGDGGAATGAALNHPTHAVPDNHGNVIIADENNQRVRMVNASGIISTIGGNGTAGYSGDGGAATNALLNFPTHVAVDLDYNVLIADRENHRIRKIDMTNGIMTTAAGNGTVGAGGDGGLAIGANLFRPFSVTVDAGGNYFISDTDNCRVRRVDVQSGKINTVAGNGMGGWNGDGTNAKSRKLNYPTDTFTNRFGVFYIADLLNQRVRGVNSDDISAVDAGPDVLTNVPVSQNGTVTNAVTIQWVQVAGPVGGSLVFSSPNTEDTMISATMDGEYIARLVATSASGIVAYDEIDFIWDTTAPFIHSDVIAEATGPNGAVVDFESGAADNLDPNPTVTSDHQSGETFPIGTTVVNVSASDWLNNSSIGSFSITIQDTTPPVISNVPADINADVNDPGGAIVFFPPATATDAVSTPTITYSNPSGSVFPLGVTVVTITATDSAGNTATATFTVTVSDSSAPVLTVPPDQIAEATSPAGAVVNYPPATATDNSNNVTFTYSQNSGTTFPLGQTTVTVTASDPAGNTSTGSFKVTVVDTTPPTIGDGGVNIINGNMTVEATSPAGAVVNFIGAVDAVDPNPTIVANPPSGSQFPLGITTVNVTATDASGNTATGSFTITVVDTTAPIVTAPADILAEANVTGGATVNYPAATASDIVTLSPAISYSQASGTVFPLGTTVVTATATDNAGNSASATFTITVQDTTPPTIGDGDVNIINGNMTVEATSPNGAIVNFIGAVDVADANPTIIANPPSGSQFPLGVTTVNVTATDASGNTATGSFTITVVDTTPPALTPPADMVVEATGPNGAAVTYGPYSVSDIVTINPAITFNPADGSTLSLGNHVITMTATDGAGNSSSATFTVLVQDTTPPTIGDGGVNIINGNLTAEATGPDGAVVNFTAAVDAVDPNPTIVANPSSGSLFPLGVTTVNVTATDASGNTASGSFTVTVVDTTTPRLTVSADITIEATSANGIVVNYAAAQATDLVSTPVITYSKASGTIFPVGTTVVTVHATDAAGNVATKTFNVIVTPDTTPPVIVPPGDITVEAGGSGGTTVTYPPADTGDATNVTYDPNSGSNFPVGDTTVTVTASDDSGNTSTGTFHIHVVDTTAPFIVDGPTATPNPGRALETETFSCFATDAQPLTWNWDFGDGKVASSAANVVEHIYLEAGTYTVTVIVTDASGNSTTKQLQLIINEALPATPPDAPPVKTAKKPMVITRLQGLAVFNKNGKDNLKVQGYIPAVAKSFDPNGQNIMLDAGGVQATFKLDAKGRSKTANGMLRLKMKYKRNKATKKKEFVGGDLKFMITLKNGAYTPAWKDEGVNPKENRKNMRMSMMTDMTFNGDVYTSTNDSSYTSKADRAGKFRYTYRKPRKTVK